MLIAVTRQIAIRLPDELVSYVDQLVRDGSGSRAAVVARALEADRRRRLAERDAEILSRTGDYPDFEHLVADLDLDDLD
jgi:Arc/MetJ-type ribon-helix-helix transcriptional regulator